MRRCALIICTLVSTAVFAGAPTRFDGLYGDGRVSDFYASTAPSSTSRPGLLLKKQPLEAALSIAGAGASYRILYASTDGVGGHDRVPVSGAIYLPAGAPPKGGWPVVSWAHGTVGTADVCAPSVQGRSLRDVTYLGRWLKEGFAVVATDYQGLGVPGPHPYLNIRAEAYSVLDAIRAAQHGFADVSHKAIVVGQSQGGQAAFAAAILAGHYAPELDIKAVVATGAPDFSSDQDIKDNFLEHPFQGNYDPAVYGVLYLLVMAKLDKSDLDLTEIVQPQAMPLFEQARAVCSARLEFDVEGSGMTRYTAFKMDKVFSTLQPYVPTIGYASLHSAVPIFMGIGAKDEEVPTEGQLKLASKACAAGTHIQAHLYAGASHSAAVNQSFDDALAFVRTALSGGTPAQECSPRAQ